MTNLTSCGEPNVASSDVVEVSLIAWAVPDYCSILSDADV